jgi:hypothetical protein
MTSSGIEAATFRLMKYNYQRDFIIAGFIHNITRDFYGDMKTRNF